MNSAAAIHEASHALLRWRFNHAVECVQVHEDNRQCFLRPKRVPLRSEIEDAGYDLGRVVSAVSGFVGERVTAGAYDEAEWLSSGDRARAIKIATTATFS